MDFRRHAWLMVALLLVGCSSSGISLTEYVRLTNEIVARASSQGEALFAEAAQITDLTPQLLQEGLERGGEIRVELQDAADAIDPPDQVADLHDLLWDWHAGFIEVERKLAAQAGKAENTAAGWQALSDSQEMAAYRSALAEGKQLCTDFQSRLDATEERGAFADTPWVPGELKEVVEAVLGCQYFPEHPEDVYRYPPAAP